MLRNSSISIRSTVSRALSARVSVTEDIEELAIRGTAKQQFWQLLRQESATT